MIIDHLKLAAELSVKHENMTLPWRFINYCLYFNGADYEMGKENIFKTDCSGVICGALLMLNYNIRTNANDLFNRVFIKSILKGEKHYHSIQAIFYKPKNESRITHVSAVVGRNVILDAVNKDMPVMLKSESEVINWYIRNNYDIYRRQIDWKKAKILSDANECSWDVDEFYKQIRRMK